MLNILIAGVGGQGTLLASVVLGKIAQRMGYDVKLSEVHGMAQRGGSVVTYVRIGDNGEKVYSPVIDMGGADILLGFEQLETLRWLPWLNAKSGKVFASSQKILPMPVITGAQKYPENIQETIRGFVPATVFADALKLAEQAGTSKAVNTVMMGVMAKSMDIDLAIWHEVIDATVKEAFRDVNRKAFDLGYNYREER